MLKNNERAVIEGIHCFFMRYECNSHYTFDNDLASTCNSESDSTSLCPSLVLFLKSLFLSIKQYLFSYKAP